MASKSKSIAELLNGDVTVTATDIADGSVITAKIADGNISTGKIADNAVTADKIVDNVALSGTTTSINGLTPQASNMQAFNRIINGAMTIDQRNAGAAVTVTGTTKFAADRFGLVRDTGAATCTGQQSSTVPNGEFTKSLLWTTTTGATAGVDDDCIIRQYVEGFNFANLGFGTATAQNFTLSFWVRSSVTGTYGVSFANSAADRCYMATYSITVANTWEFKTITVVGDTTGTWVPDAGLGLRIFWDMGSGTSRSIAASSAWGSSYGTGLTGGVKIAANTGATFYITGVQLEAGSTASSFAHENYSDTLQKCLRFYEQIAKDGNNETLIGNGFGYANGTLVFQYYKYNVQKRVIPTLSYTGAAVSNIQCLNGSGFWNQATNLQFTPNRIGTRLLITITGVSTNNACETRIESSLVVHIDAEL